MTIDSDGEIVNAQDYYPFGAILRSYITGSSVNDKYKFTEKERDIETSYDYFGARYYDSEIGRWLSVDPLAHLRPGLSPYQYVQNNPLNRWDPTGMIDWRKITGGTITTVAGLGETITGGAIAAGTSVTVVGAVGGTALMMHGLATTGFGFAQIIDGFVESKNEIPSGPLEAAGKLGGETGETVGAIADGLVGLGGATKSLKGSLKSVDNLFPTSTKEAKNLTTSKKVEGIIGIGDIIGTTSSAETVKSNYVEIVEDKKKKK
jgi:RHS repeat-associated protein